MRTRRELCTPKYFRSRESQEACSSSFTLPPSGPPSEWNGIHLSCCRLPQVWRGGVGSNPIDNELVLPVFVLHILHIFTTSEEPVARLLGNKIHSFTHSFIFTYSLIQKRIIASVHSSAFLCIFSPAFGKRAQKVNKLNAHERVSTLVLTVLAAHMHTWHENLTSVS